MRGIIAVIGVMTLMIFIALGLLAYGMVTHSPKHGPAAATAAPANLLLPAGASIKMMSPWKNGVALDVTAPDGEYLYFVDPETAPVRVGVTREK